MKTLYIIPLLFLMQPCVGQTFCHTTSNASTALTTFNAYRYEPSGQNNNPYIIKVYFHIIRMSGGRGGQTEAAVNTAFRILNRDFAAHKISFSKVPSIDYINDNNYYYGSSLLDNLWKINNHADGVDIYLLPSNSPIKGGKANGFGAGSELWVSGSYDGGNSFATSSVVSHEMGHVLFLYHTHHGSAEEPAGPAPYEDPNACEEDKVIPPQQALNCQDCGDYVCDTPADPNLKALDPNRRVNTNTCAYIGGMGYHPDTRNIMSYTSPSCMAHFTAGQGQRMRDALAREPVLQKVATSCVPTEKEIAISGPSSMKFDEEGTFRINNPGGTATWSAPGFTVLSRDNNSIQVRAIGFPGTISVSVSASVADPCATYRGAHSVLLFPADEEAFIIHGPTFNDYRDHGYGSPPPERIMSIESLVPPILTTEDGTIEVTYSWHITPSPPDVTIIPHGNEVTFVFHYYLYSDPRFNVRLYILHKNRPLSGYNRNFTFNSNFY